MSDRKDLKQIWHGQRNLSPDKDVVISRINQFKKEKRRRLILLNVLGLLTLIFYLIIWKFVPFKQLTTVIGIGLILVGTSTFLILYNLILPRLAETKSSQTCNGYIQNLLRLKHRETLLQKKVLNIYFINLLLGICLYLIEYTSMMTLGWAVLVYVLTLVWFGVCWIYLRPIAIGKQQNAINTIIEQLNGLKSQLRFE